MANNNMPSFNVYTVEDRGENDDPFWLKIGAAFQHKDEKGYNIVLSAFPIDNRLCAARARRRYRRGNSGQVPSRLEIPEKNVKQRLASASCHSHPD